MTPTRVDVFRIPTRISFGRGVALTVATPLQQVGAKRVLVVTDKGVRNAGLVTPIEERLRDAGFVYEVYDEVVPDPGVDAVQRCYERAREMRADAFVAVGGGSAIDTAKMAATLLTNGGTVLDYVGIDRVPKPAAPVSTVAAPYGSYRNRSTTLLLASTSAVASQLASCCAYSLSLKAPEPVASRSRSSSAST